MYNYRRVYTSTSKFKTIYGNFKSPVFLDGSGAKFTQGECILYHELKLEVFR